jgi:hypothetical protein
LRSLKNVLSVDRELKKDGRRLDRFYVIICIIAMQLQFIIHFVPLSSGFHFYKHAFLSLLRVFYALPTLNCHLLQRHVSDVTLTHAEITDITLSRMTLAPAAILCPGFGTRPDRRGGKVRKGQRLWVHTYPTVSSRPRESCERSLVQIGSEM